MRTIKEDEDLKTLVKVGDIVRLEGFTDEPVIAVVAMGEGNCNGCAIGSALGCSVSMRDHKGTSHNVSPCCLRPSWMCKPGTMPIFGIFKDINSVLEDL